MKISFNKNLLYLLSLIIVVLIFFFPVFFHDKIPIPADTIVGLYHPFRDVVWNSLEAGVPFKNFLITDAVRQQYPWRKLAFDLLKSGELPGWNPYTHLGTPLAANIQTAIFYPLNVLFFLLPFNTAWTSQVILQQVLLAIFSFLYLKEIGRSNKAATIASLALTFSGFSVAWLEWNTTLHTLTWLPLALLSIEKLLKQFKPIWLIILVFSLMSISLAGFLQTAFYSYSLITLYLIFKTILAKRDTRKNFVSIALAIGISLSISAVLLSPSFQLIANSARDIDQGDVLSREDWFLPPQHLIQFIAPDFFGNPTTLNYWGVFNYTEFIGYIGIIPLIFAVLALLSMRIRSSEKTVKIIGFYGFILFVSLLFATPNLISKLPFELRLPLLSTAQPSRMIMVTVFSMSVLSAFGIDYFFEKMNEKQGNKTSLSTNAALMLVTLAILSLWVVALIGGQIWPSLTSENLAVSKRNLILPTLLFTASLPIFIFPLVMENIKFFNKYKKYIPNIIFLTLFIFISFDLLRFARKFTPFSDPDFLYPQTETIKFLQSDTSTWRYMTTDRRILPPNFSVAYRIQTIEGYDPIYLSRFGQLIASAQQGKPVLKPTPFHRIIRPDNFESPIYDILNVKYILSLSDLKHPKLERVLQEGKTRIYENKNIFPRAFLLPNYVQPKSDLEALETIFNLDKDDIKFSAQIINYKENIVSIEVTSDTGGMLVLSDTYYPGWKATLDGKPTDIQRVLYALRGTIVPPGKHEVLYRYSKL